MSLDIYIKDENLNVTHNLNEMAMHIPVSTYYTLYDITWDAEENNFKHARQITKLLAEAVKYMLVKRNVLEKYNPDNGWGSYTGLLSFVMHLIEVTIKHPRAKIRISK